MGALPYHCCKIGSNGIVWCVIGRKRGRGGMNSRNSCRYWCDGYD